MSPLSKDEGQGLGTFHIDLFPVGVRQGRDLPLELLLLLHGLFLQVGLVWAHGQGQPVSVLLQGHLEREREALISIMTDEKFHWRSGGKATGDMRKRPVFIHLKVELDFVLEEPRVLLQGPSEPRNALVDLQQLHRVAVMVPR